jgi:hypothetical protein
MLRNLTKREANLIELLAKRGSFHLPLGWNERTKIEPYEDGLNRLFTLHPKGFKEDKERGPAKPLKSDFVFHDKDGSAVSAFLYLDQQGELFELDLWKMDNDSPLIEIPECL